MEQRRFALRTLRDFGMGKTGMEELVAEEVEDLCQRSNDSCGKHSFKYTFCPSSSRLEKENGQLLEMKSFFNRCFDNFYFF